MVVTVKNPFEEGLIAASPLTHYCLLCPRFTSLGTTLASFRCHFTKHHSDTHCFPSKLTGMPAVFRQELLRARTQPLSEFYDDQCKTAMQYVCGSCCASFVRKDAIEDHIRKIPACDGAKYERKMCVQLFCGSYTYVPDAAVNVQKQQKILHRGRSRFFKPCRSKACQLNDLIATPVPDVEEKLRPLLQPGEDVRSWASILFPLLKCGEDWSTILSLRKKVNQEMRSPSNAIIQKFFDLVDWTFDDRILPVINTPARIRTILQKFSGTDDLDLANNWVFSTRKDLSLIHI